MDYLTNRVVIYVCCVRHELDLDRKDVHLTSVSVIKVTPTCTPTSSMNKVAKPNMSLLSAEKCLQHCD